MSHEHIIFILTPDSFEILLKFVSNLEQISLRNSDIQIYRFPKIFHPKYLVIICIYELASS